MKNRDKLEQSRYFELQGKLNKFVESINFNFTEHKENTSDTTSEPNKKVGILTKLAVKKAVWSFKRAIQNGLGADQGSNLLKMLNSMIDFQLSSANYLSDASYSEFNALLNNVRSQLIELRSLKVNPDYLRDPTSQIAKEIQQILTMRKEDVVARTEADSKLEDDSQELVVQKSQLLHRYMTKIKDFKTELTRYAHLKDVEGKQLDEKTQKLFMQVQKLDGQIREIEAPLNNLLVIEKSLIWESQHKTKKVLEERTFTEDCALDLGYPRCRNCGNHTRTEKVEVDAADNEGRELAKWRLQQLPVQIEAERERLKQFQSQLHLLNIESGSIQTQMSELKKLFTPIQLYQNKFSTIFQNIEAVLKSSVSSSVQDALRIVDDFFNQNPTLYADLGYICNHLNLAQQKTLIEFIGLMKCTQQSLDQFVQNLDPKNEDLIISARQIKSVEMVARETKMAEREKRKQQAMIAGEGVAVRAEGQPIPVMAVPSAPMEENESHQQVPAVAGASPVPVSVSVSVVAPIQAPPVIPQATPSEDLSYKVPPSAPPAELFDENEPGLPISNHRRKSMFQSVPAPINLEAGVGAAASQSVKQTSKKPTLAVC